MSNKFKHPFTSTHSFSSYEEAKKAALTFDEIKKRVEAGRTVKMFIVTALAPYTSVEEVYTNKNLINNYTYSDIGRQIGYKYVDDSRAYCSNKLRSFTSDIGLGDEYYNRHLVFSSKVEAEAYMKFVKTSTSLIAEEKIHQAECDLLDTYCNIDWDYNLDNEYANPSYEIPYMEF